MVPVDRDQPNGHPQNQTHATPLTDEPTGSVPPGAPSSGAGPMVVPASASTSVSTSANVRPITSVPPPRPSTAPPSQPPLLITTTTIQPPQSRTALLSTLRARNLLLQKAISHIDDAVLHLLAARSGIPSAKIQEVRGEAKSRKELLDRVDRAIMMAKSGQVEWGVGGGGPTGTGNERPNTSAGSTSTPHPGAIPPNSIPTQSPGDAPQLRRSSSQPQLGPTAVQHQVPNKIYTLPELIERRTILQESIVSWQNAAAQLRAAFPHLQALYQPLAQPAPGQPGTTTLTPTTNTTTTPTATTNPPVAPPSISNPPVFPPSPSNPSPSPSWTAKYQQTQFEIKRREELMVRLNQAIAQLSSTPPPNPEVVSALASYMPPPLDRPRFDTAYAHFCQGKSMEMNTTIIMPDVRRPVIELYALHVAVMQEGSFARVTTRKSWDLVGARLGFVQTPATPTEPAKSSPEIAAHLERAYKDRLQQFDYLYVSSVIESVRKRMGEQKKQ